MSTTPFVTPTHAVGGYQPGFGGASIPARRPGRKFVPAPVHQPSAPASVADTDQTGVADAVLELLRSVNRSQQ